MIQVHHLLTGLLVLTCLAVSPGIRALSGVNPTGVNINRHGVTTVFLTFQGTAGEARGDAFWCLRLNAPPNTVTSTNPCVSGTIIGALPGRLDLSRGSGPLLLPGVVDPDTSGRANTTDIMTIPASVSRRALQAAREGQPSQFFYVREFVDGGGRTSYISVTCRMAGGGARSPFALLHVETQFDTGEDRPVSFFDEDVPPPPVVAMIRYSGTGRLRGRWEVVMPGEPLPSEIDLLPAGSLPVELRSQQKPYSVLSRFDVLLPPVGEYRLPGPAVELIPVRLRGAYQLLLRIEATEDKEGDSNTLFGIARSGGAAGFALPALRYYVGSPGSELPQTASATLALIGPVDGTTVLDEQPLYFSWKDELVRPGLRLELAVESAEDIFFSALLPGGSGHYLLPRHIRGQAGREFVWRIVSTETQRAEETTTEWRTVHLTAPETTAIESE